jgi:hypothetical protein
LTSIHKKTIQKTPKNNLKLKNLKAQLTTIPHARAQLRVVIVFFLKNKN